MVTPDFSVIVPVHNEADTLPLALPALLLQVEQEGGEVIFLCNGCTDGSETYLRQFASARVRVHAIPVASKTEALAEGEALAQAWPLFYCDADVVLAPGCLAALLETLACDDVQLACPRIFYDTRGTSWPARLFVEALESLPHMQNTAFCALMGVTKAGRAQFGTWRDLPAPFSDDGYIAGSIPAPARRIVETAHIATFSPKSLMGWIRVRARWRRADRNAEAFGIELPRSPENRIALLTLFIRKPLSATAYTTAVIMGRLLALWNLQGWYRDRGNL